MPESIEPIADRKPFHLKKPLKRAVQLIKRWRDKLFLGREELLTPSIVVTRLAADFYDGDVCATDSVQIILDRMHYTFSAGRPVIHNPVNPKEVISEKWESNPESFDAFKVAIADFREKWRALPSISGAHKLSAALFDLFGDQAVDAVKESFEEIENAKAQSSLHVSRGTRTLLPAAGASSMKSPNHTFFHGE